MAKVLIIPNNEESGQICNYNTVTGTCKTMSKGLMDRRCPSNYRLRIDMLVGTPYEVTYLISHEQYDNIKALQLKPQVMLTRELFAYGILIANSIKGVRSDKGPLYNLLATRHYFRDNVADDINIYFKIGAKSFKVQPHCSDDIIDTKDIFKVTNLTKEANIRELLGINIDTSVKALLKELNLQDNQPKGTYITSTYYDGNNFTYNRLYKVEV